MATISDELAAGLTKILQLAQLDIQNLDKLFNGNGDITINRADGSTFLAATWAKMMAATVDNMKKRGSLGVNNLNEINGTLDGFWTQGATSNAIASRNYPEQIAGSLLVMQNATNNAAGCTQMYFPHNNNNCYVRTGVANASGISSWTTWQKLAFTNDPEFTGKVVCPNAIHIRKDQAIIKSDANDSITFRLGGTTDSVLIDGKGLYANGRIDPVQGFQSHLGIGSASGSNKYCYGWTGGRMALYVDTTTVGYLQTEAVSDRELKFEIQYLSDIQQADQVTPEASALNEVMNWRPAFFRFKPRGELLPASRQMLGFIANDLKKTSPECVEGEGLEEGAELDPLKAYRLDQTAMIAKMTMAMQAQQEMITELQNTVNDLKTKLVS